MILYEGKIVTGLETGAASATVPATYGRFKEALVGALVPRRFEASQRSLVYSGCTAATGVAPGTTIATTTMGFSLYNPLNSGYLLVPLRVSLGYVSGTLGAGTVYYLANTNTAAAATTGTAITVSNARLGMAPDNIGKLYTTATVPANPTALRPAFLLDASLASTVSRPGILVDDLDGEFVLDQGSTLSLHATAAAGSSPLVVYGMTWMEVPV